MWHFFLPKWVKDGCMHHWCQSICKQEETCVWGGLSLRAGIWFRTHVRRRGERLSEDVSILIWVWCGGGACQQLLILVSTETRLPAVKVIVAAPLISAFKFPDFLWWYSRPTKDRSNSLHAIQMYGNEVYSPRLAHKHSHTLNFESLSEPSVTFCRACEVITLHFLIFGPLSVWKLMENPFSETKVKDEHMVAELLFLADFLWCLQVLCIGKLLVRED